MAKPPIPPIDLPPTAGLTDPLTREALAWVVHLHSGNESEADHAGFEDWKATSDAHAKAAHEATRLWHELGAALKPVGKPKNRLIPILVAVGVGLAAVLGSGVFGPSAGLFAKYRTGIGEVRTVKLNDGSIVDLDTGTKFDVSADNRVLTLYSGQVFVSVKRDPERPFRVVTARTNVEALGTAFAVRHEGTVDRVVVTEHAVRVIDLAQNGSGILDVVAGQSVAVGASGIGSLEAADVDSLTAWRNGELRFNGRPLGTVAAEIDRYRYGRILILDREISTLPVTGNLDIRNADAFLETLSLALPVYVARFPGMTFVWRDPLRPIPGR